MPRLRTFAAHIALKTRRCAEACPRDATMDAVLADRLRGRPRRGVDLL